MPMHKIGAPHVVSGGDSIANSAPATAATREKTAPAAAKGSKDGIEGAGKARAEALRHLGVDDRVRLGPARIGKSEIFELLGAKRFAEMQAVNVPGKVAWVNFELARQLGFEVPAGNRVTPEFEKQLLDALSFRILKSGEEVGGRNTVKVRADKYGGDGIGNNLGAGRAAFLPWGNLNIKGIGLTPLAEVRADDFQHSHGGAPMREGFLEAIWGEVNSNLFTEGSTRILAVIDNGDFTEWPDGTREKRALIVRAGRQLRPAHMIDAHLHGGAYSKEVFLAAARDSGDLVTKQARGGKEGAPDLSATLSNLIDRQARTAAEQVRWRLIHGAISTSNMELDGSQLDLGTESSQPRTAAVKILPFTEAFGEEHQVRGTQLQRIYDALRETLNPKEREQLHAPVVDVGAEMQQRYDSHLEHELLTACGLKGELVDALRAAPPDKRAKVNGATKLAEVIKALSAMSNPGDKLADKQVVEDGAVVDVFNLLRAYPAIYFADPKADHTDQIRELLQPICRGTPKQQEKKQRSVEARIRRFQRAYNVVMQRALQQAAGAYDDTASLQRAVVAKAEFENRPIDALYRSRLNDTLGESIDSYLKTGDTHVFTEGVDKAIAGSVRNADALLNKTGVARLPDGDLELNARVIDGVHYAVRASKDGSRRLAVGLDAVSKAGQGLELENLGSGLYSSEARNVHLQPEQLEHLRYRFTTDGWKSWQEAPARLVPLAGEAARVEFDIPVLRSDIGQLEGVFHCDAGGDMWIKDGTSNFRGYDFAIPDNKEFGDLERRV
jgi:hypothetical protein